MLGIEPAANVAAAARGARRADAGVALFGRREARARWCGEGRRADLVIGNNVLAQVSDLNDFVAGMAAILAPEGVVTLEFPHLARLLEEEPVRHHLPRAFLVLLARDRRARASPPTGCACSTSRSSPTHGGSLRLYACRGGRPALAAQRRGSRGSCARSGRAGLERLETLRARSRERVQEVKRGLLEFLIRCRREGERVAGYGAPGQGQHAAQLLRHPRRPPRRTRSIAIPYKQGKFLPGTHIPIFAPERIAETRPDYLLILPWNLRDEIMAQMAFIRDWGGRFVVADPGGAGPPMIFTETTIPGAFVIDPERLVDERGFFARTWCMREFAAHGLNPRTRPVQHLLQRAGGHAARPALPGCRPTPRPSSCAVRAAPSTT